MNLLFMRIQQAIHLWYMYFSVCISYFTKKILKYHLQYSQNTNYPRIEQKMYKMSIRKIFEKY